MKSFIEMICEADDEAEQVNQRLEIIKDKKTPAKTLVGLIHNKNEKVSAAARKELQRRKEAGEEVEGFEDEDSEGKRESQADEKESSAEPREHLPPNADSIARELNIDTSQNQDKDKKSANLNSKPSEIILNPEYQARLGISEARKRAVVFSFGRLNPITIGHEKLAKKLSTVAAQKSATAALFISASQDKKKNPLPYDKKLKYAKIAFPKLVRDLPRETKAFGMLIGILKNLDKQFDDVTMVVGSDRVETMRALLNKYNGKEFNFDSVDVVSAGERDPDADDVSGMSASKMRELAVKGEFSSFKAGLPTRLRSSAKSVYDDIRSVMITEETEEGLNERVLNVQQRLKKRSTMRRSKGKVRVGQRKAIRRKASGKVIDRRAKRLAIRFMRKRVLKGKKYADLSYSARAAVDRIVARRAVAIKRIAQRLSPKVRRAESQRKAGSGYKSVSLSPSRKVRKEHLEHYPLLNDKYGDYMTEENFLDFVHNVFDHLSEEFSVNLSPSDQAYLMKKSEESGETFDTLKKVFDRGVAAWSMGVHEDVTPQQWGFSRVNSFINEGKTRHTADIDLVEADLFGVSKSITPIINMHSYKAAKKSLKQEWDLKKDQAEAGPTHSIDYYAEQIAKRYQGVDAKKLASMVKEQSTKDAYGNPINVADIGAKIMSPMSFKQFVDTSSKTEQVKEPTGDLKDACWKGYTAVGTKMKNGRKVPNCVPEETEAGLAESSNYKLYHSTYTSAINHAFAHHEKKGLKVSDDDRWDKVAVGSKKPGSGKTTTVNIPATHSRTGKKHMIHVQVYNKGGSNPYELNTYSSTTRAMQKEETAELDESFNDRQIKMAYGILNDKRYKGGNLTKAVSAIERIKRGLSKHPSVQRAMKATSEEYGAGFEGTSGLVKKYKEDTPCQEQVEAGDSEQLAELSKDTLRSYASKAVGDVSKKSTTSMQLDIQARKMRRASGESSYTKKLSKASADLHAKAKKRLDSADKALRKLSEADVAEEGNVEEATYQGKKVPLNKPMKGDVKKSKVYVDPDGDGKAQKVNFGDPDMTIKKNIPARRKSFRARHKCDTAKDKTTPRYWSCKAW